jgi:pyrimidine deaminase RibD-like protein
MGTVDDLSKQILADLVDDFRAKNLGSDALSNGYEGASIVALEMKCCAGPYSKVDFDLALKQLEESKFVDTGPRVPVQNPPGSPLVFVGLHHNKRQFVYLTEKGYKAAQKSTPKPRSPAPSVPISGGTFHTADADRKYARFAIDEARKSVPENDGRPHPWVGAVVVKDGKVLGTAHRGEVPGNHAEFVALERILTDVAVAGATVYTTLEPCTTRNPPKIPCVDRLIERRVARVVIGILDPDERIRGKGQRKLSNAGIETSLFPHDLAMEVEELNREFTRFCGQQRQSAPKHGNEPDLWLEFHPTGSRALRIQNSGAEPAFDVVIHIPADGSGFKSDVINRLDNDRGWVYCGLNGNLVYLEAIRKALAEAVLQDADIREIPVLITYRTRKRQDCEAHLEIRLPLKNGIQFALPEVAEEHAKRTRVEAKLTVAQLISTPVEEMNREFVRSQKDRQASAKMPTTDEDQSSWPDVILECQWPSLVHESKIPGSHTVRKRPWMLRHGGPGAVYNVCVHDIDFGEYEARFPFPVRTLTDAASVHPIICWKSDGLVITAHDLESLIHNPPSGCDVQQYAVKTDGNEGEEIRLEDFVLEVEIPVTISYDDKNGNRFKIRYLLHYDTYMEKGEMIRIGRIEKVAPV